jgi:UDP:flavonoid glycosyltransferase YjiC (YdhE family)
MKVLFVSIGSYGLLMPLIGAAEELARRGHRPVVLTHRRGRALVETAGIASIEGTAGEEGLSIEGWWTPRQMVPQFHLVRDAIVAERPDVVMADSFTVGAIMAARAEGVPAAVLGPAAYIHPVGGIPAGDVGARIRGGRYARLVEGYNEAAQTLGLPAASATMNDDSPFLGDRYLLRSVPTFEAYAAQLPPRVRYAGACLHDSTDRDEELAAWIAGDAAPVAFVQIEKLFDFNDPIAVLFELLEARGLRVAAALGQNAERYDDWEPEAFFVRSHLPQAQALASARIAVSTGHAMAVLGAIVAGVPNLILDFGSGAPELLHCCVTAGNGAGLLGMSADAESLAPLLDRVLNDDGMRTNALRIQRAFAEVDSFPTIAAVLAELARTPHVAKA